MDVLRRAMDVHADAVRTALHGGGRSSSGGGGGGDRSGGVGGVGRSGSGNSAAGADMCGNDDDDDDILAVESSVRLRAFVLCTMGHAFALLRNPAESERCVRTALEILIEGLGVVAGAK